MIINKKHNISTSTTSVATVVMADIRTISTFITITL